jgi:L-arabinokinase
MQLRYYISGHGLGHASRSGQIINTLRRRHPWLPVEVVSDAAPWFFRDFLDSGVPVRVRAIDPGMVQHDSLRMDESATLQAWQELLPRRERQIETEATDLRTAEVTLVAADIPALPFAAAHQAGIPCVGLSNFTWDWIYAGLATSRPGFAAVAAALAAEYARADRLLALPFAGDFPAIPRIERLPLVARKARRSRQEARRVLELPPGMKVGLISFGGFGLSAFDFSPLGRLGDWIFLTEAALAGTTGNLKIIPPGLLPYPELVAAADVVITKPGYGIVAECIAHGTAVLYTGRGKFREQDLLIAGLHRYARALEIDNSRLRTGDWGECLATLLELPPPEMTLATDGDQVAADRLAELARASGP